MAAVVFDLDGTLVDSVTAIRDVANTLMVELALPPLDLAETRGYIGNGAAVFLERALQARGALGRQDLGETHARFEELYAEAPGAANPPMPGVIEALADLASAGHRLAICTNKPYAPTAAVVAAWGWESVFTTVIAGDTLAHRKPHPAPLLEAVHRLAADRVVYVGDSEVDAATAEAAGIAFLLFTEGYRRAPVAELNCTAVFSHYRELPALVERHASRVGRT